VSESGCQLWNSNYVTHLYDDAVNNSDDGV
jgi:hypothetical protein